MTDREMQEAFLLNNKVTKCPTLILSETNGSGKCFDYENEANRESQEFALQLQGFNARRFAKKSKTICKQCGEEFVAKRSFINCFNGISVVNKYCPVCNTRPAKQRRKLVKQFGGVEILEEYEALMSIYGRVYVKIKVGKLKDVVQLKEHIQMCENILKNIDKPIIVKLRDKLLLYVNKKESADKSVTGYEFDF